MPEYLIRDIHTYICRYIYTPTTTLNQTSGLCREWQWRYRQVRVFFPEGHPQPFTPLQQYFHAPPNTELDINEWKRKRFFKDQQLLWSLAQRSFPLHHADLESLPVLSLASCCRNTGGPTWIKITNNWCKTVFDVSILFHATETYAFMLILKTVMWCPVSLSRSIRKPSLLSSTKVTWFSIFIDAVKKEYMAFAALFCRKKCISDWLKKLFPITDKYRSLVIFLALT